jgi:RNA recognition motif-containing protein
VGKKLHVGNLTNSATSSDLQGWFTPFGTVQSAIVVSDRETGRSKGFGFVEMDTDAEALAAIQGLHDQVHDGRRLTVDEARPRVARTIGLAGGSIDGGGRTGGGGGYGGSGRPQY